MWFGNSSGLGPDGGIQRNPPYGLGSDTSTPSEETTGCLRRTPENGCREGNRFGRNWFAPVTPKSGDTSKSGPTPIRLTHHGATTLQNVRSAKSSASLAMKLGLNRHETGSASGGALQRPEPDEGKLSRPVLRGGSGGNAALLPDQDRASFPPYWSDETWSAHRTFQCQKGEIANNNFHAFSPRFILCNPLQQPGREICHAGAL